MRRSSISVRVSGSNGTEMEDAIFARQSLIEELLSHQYNASTFVIKKEEPKETKVTVLGGVTLVLTKWDNKSGFPSLTSKAKNIPSEPVNTADSNSGRSNIRYTMTGNIDNDSNSNRSYSIYTGESDTNTMTVMIDEDDLSLDDYEDEDLDGGDYDYGDDDDDEDADDGIEDMELAEALRIVRGKKAWSVNDYRARYKALKRKVGSDGTNSVSAKIDNYVIDNHEENMFNGKPIRMVKIVIEGEDSEEYGSLSVKNATSARLREKYVRVVQSGPGPVTNLRASLSKDNQDPENVSSGFNSASYSSPNYVEAYEPVDGELAFYF